MTHELHGTSTQSVAATREPGVDAPWHLDATATARAPRATGGPRATTMAPAVSVALDLLRFLLALMVAFGHCTQPYFQHDWPDLTGAAVVAVGGFFILSGYTIRSFSPADASFDLQRFFVDRASRLLSLSLPALALTVLLDLYAAHAAPGWYALNWGADADHPALRLIANAVLFTQAWGSDIVPFSNSPFWSLSYEVGFYAIWGAFVYCRTKQRSLAIVLAVALLFGPNIVAMMTLWLIGVGTYDVFARKLAHRRLVALLALACGGALLLIVFHAPLKPLLANGIDAVFDLLGGNRRRIGPGLVFGALLFGCLLIALLAALRLAEPRLNVSRRLVRVARSAGEATFPLYLFHFPILVAVSAAHLYNPHSALQKLLVLASIVALAFAIAPLGQRMKTLLRTWMNRALA